MKHYPRGRYAVFEGDVQTVPRQQIDLGILKSPLLHGHVMRAVKLAVKRLVGRADDGRPHASDSAVTHELWTYQIAVYEGGYVYQM
jgi:hypothetical protein